MVELDDGNWIILNKMFNDALMVITLVANSL